MVTHRFGVVRSHLDSTTKAVSTASTTTSTAPAGAYIATHTKEYNWHFVSSLQAATPVEQLDMGLSEWLVPLT